MVVERKSRGAGRRVEIGLDYPTFQLVKALRNRRRPGTLDETGGAKVEQWHSVVERMFSGALTIGARTPVKDVPPWVTLEVVTGGFATGEMLAGGALTVYERGLARELGMPEDGMVRAALNAYFLSEPGQSRLRKMLANGRYRVEVPEEGALLVVAWLIDHGDIPGVRSVLDTVMPFFDRLRFFPEPSDVPAASETEVCLRSVGDTAAALSRVSQRRRPDAQAEAIEVWTPLYDRAIELLLETVDGAPPHVDVDPSGKPIRDPNGNYRVRGGDPCRVRTPNWDGRAIELLDDYREAIARHGHCKRWHRPNKPFRRFLAAIETLAADDDVADAERRYLRIAIARIVAKRGLPDSATYADRRAQQSQQCAGARHHEIAGVLIRRLDALPATDGLRDMSIARAPVTAEEATGSVRAGTVIPGYLTRKVGRAQVATVRELVDAGYITSADVLADVLPQVTSHISASGIVDPDLRRLYALLYRVFRRRRSLLLLNLQSQVKLDELPWVSVLDRHREEAVSDRRLAQIALRDLLAMTLTHFAYAILPNKLVQELDALSKQAGLDVPFVKEIAADIFMGAFAPSFERAALVAADLLEGTLYERYYGISFAEVRSIVSRPVNGEASLLARLWARRFRKRQASEAAHEGFAELCVRLAEPKAGGWSVAANGLVLEQSQIITTQNLAVAFRDLDVGTLLAPQLEDLAKSCFAWICARQQRPLSEYRARLRMVKNTAYAWRQMIFYLSLVDSEKQTALMRWMDAHLSEQSAALQTRFDPAMKGLWAVAEGKDVSAEGGRRFLGWTIGPHWLLAGEHSRQ